MSTLAVDEALLERIRDDAEASERGRELSPATVAGLSDAGVLRALVPSELGGGEAHPLELREAVEAIAAADGAAGWIAAVSSTAGLAAAHLAPDDARELFGPGAIPAGVFAPIGRLSAGDSGPTLSGRWPLGSGVTFSTVVGLGCIGDDGPRYALVPRDAVEVIDTWDSLGLRATASHDVAVAEATVTPGRVIDLVAGEPAAGGTLSAFPLFGLLAVAVSAVCTGIAEGALTDIVALASVRRPAGSTRALADRETTRERVAGSTAALRAAVAGVERAIASAWAGAEAGGPLRLADRAALRIAATHAARTAVEVVDACHRLGGARALYRGSTLERRQRDVHTAAQHMVVAPATMELAGRVLLGVEADTAQL